MWTEMSYNKLIDNKPLLQRVNEEELDVFIDNFDEKEWIETYV